MTKDENEETQPRAREAGRRSAERNQSRQQEDVGDRSIDSRSIGNGHGGDRPGLGRSGVHADKFENIGGSMDQHSWMAGHGYGSTDGDSGVFCQQAEKIKIPKNLAPMLMLYMWLGLEFARDEVVSTLKSNGSGTEGINHFFSEVSLAWRNQIIATYVAIGLFFTLIRKFLSDDSAFGLIFSLGGAFFIFLAIMAVKRFYQQPRKTNSFL